MRYRFAYRPYRRTLRVPLRTAHGLWGEREGVFVRLEAETGEVGYGEASPIPWFGTESVEEVVRACAAIGPDVDDRGLESLPPGLACLRFAVAAAREPLRGTGEGTTRLPVATLLPAGRAALEVVPDRLAAGFLCCKWKVGVDRPEEELGLLDDLLGALPPYVRLRLDANGAWDRRTAEKWLARCAERPIEFVEQPVAADEEDLLLGLAADFPVKLALDESVTGLASARAWQARGWPGVFVIKPALAGPLSELIEWAKATKPDLVLSSAIESALGRAAILQAAFAHGLTQRALGFGVGEIFGDRLWDGPMIGPLVDGSWAQGVEQEALWNAAN